MLTPLILSPIYRTYLWGGRRFETALGRTLPGEGVYAESWQLVDRGTDQSVVSAGPLAGATLSGFGAFAIWRSAYLTKLGSWRNRVQVPLDWLRTLVFGRDTTLF